MEKEIKTPVLSQTIPEIVEEVKIAMCDQYCKYPNEIKDDEELYEICIGCPLCKLG